MAPPAAGVVTFGIAMLLHRDSPALTLGLVLAVSVLAAPARAQTLDIYIVDVEGGNATLFVSPTHESLLIDTGNAGAAAARDAGRIMDAIRAEAPNTIVILTADNGAWQDAYPDAGTSPFRGEKGSAFEGGWRVPGLMCWPQHIPAGAKYDEMMSHIDCWATLAKMVGLPPHGG